MEGRRADGARADRHSWHLHRDRHAGLVHRALLHRAERAEDARGRHGRLLHLLQPAPGFGGDGRRRLRRGRRLRGGLRVGQLPWGLGPRGDGTVMRRASGQTLTAVLLALLGVFILGPDGWTLSWWKAVFDDPNLKGSVVLSFEFALVTMAVSALICLPAAYAFARFDFPGRRFFLIG